MWATNWKNKRRQGQSVCPAGDWSIGTTPVMAYDWAKEVWTISLRPATSKTLGAASKHLRIELETNYYVDQPDALGS